MILDGRCLYRWRLERSRKIRGRICQIAFIGFDPYSSGSCNNLAIRIIIVIIPASGTEISFSNHTIRHQSDRPARASPGTGVEGIVAIIVVIIIMQISRISTVG